MDHSLEGSLIQGYISKMAGLLLSPSTDDFTPLAPIQHPLWHIEMFGFLNETTRESLPALIPQPEIAEVSSTSVLEASAAGVLPSPTQDVKTQPRETQDQRLLQALLQLRQSGKIIKSTTIIRKSTASP